MHTEVLSKEMIRTYLDTLLKSFSLVRPVSDKALSVLFSANLFGECIKEIKDKMHIPCALHVYYYDDHNFPGEDNTAAFISLPIRMPLYISNAFANLSLQLKLRKSMCSNYHVFVYCIAHELSHVVLHSTGHALRYSEIATDLFVMVCGFENFVERGRNNGGYGYLDDVHFLYAQHYLKRLRKGKPGLTFWEKVAVFVRGTYKHQC